MLFIGITISYIKLSKFKISKDMIGVVLGRFLFSPLITFDFSLIFTAPALMKCVFLVQAVLPVMANTAIVTKEYGADYEFASIMIAVTTVLSLFFIPIYKFLLG